MLCQVQEIPPGTPQFTPREVKIGKFLADTGAQVNIGNYELFEMMGISNKEKYLRRSQVKINGIGGAIDTGVREQRVSCLLYTSPSPRD